MSNYAIIDGELYHHGVKGMRWGVRRYQNEDGTLTAAGKRRQAKSDRKASIKRGKLAKDEYRQLTDESYSELEKRYQKKVDQYYQSEKYKKYMESPDFDPDYDETFDMWERMYSRWEKSNTKLKLLGEQKVKDLDAYENHQAMKTGIGIIAAGSAFVTGFGAFLVSEFLKAP